MKLDFLKKGFVNTANFIPNFAYGNVNKNPVSIGINVMGRLLSMYLYFQFNPSLDIKSIIIAILFPTLYIVYIIAINGIDNVLDLFGLETGTFTNIFSDTDEQCVEKRGPSGDLPSNPTDKEQCGNVIMGQQDSRTQCEDKKDSSGLRICKYIGGSDTKYRSCSSIANETSCNSSDLSCRWDTYQATDLSGTKAICDEAEINNGTRFGVSIDDCPGLCPYYFNDIHQGMIQFGITGIFVNYSNVVKTPVIENPGGNDVILSFGSSPSLHSSPSSDFGTNQLILKVSPGSVNPFGFTPHTSNAYGGSAVDIIYINENVPYKILKGTIKSISQGDPTLGAAYTETDPNTQLNKNSGSYFIILENVAIFPTPTSGDVDWNSLANFKVQVKLPTSSNTCGMLYDSIGNLTDYDTTEVSGTWDSNNMKKFDTPRNTGVCNSAS